MWQIRFIVVIYSELINANKPVSSMTSTQPIKKLLLCLWQYINPRRRVQIAFLFGLLIFTSLAEILSIGAVLPFLGVLTNPELVFNHPLAQPVILALDITEAQQLLLPFTVAFGIAAIVAGAARLLMLWATTRISFAIGAELSISMYRRTLYQPYLVHCSRNSSELINGISGKANSVIYNTIVPVLTLVSSIIMLTAILVTLLTFNPIIALSAFGGFGLIYSIIIKLTRKRLLINSQINARESTQVIKSLQEGLGGIRDVLIDGTQETYSQIYSNADRPYRRAQGDSLFISSSPRYVMEALAMSLIAALAYAMSQQPDGLAKAIPVLGALAIGAQRLLPVLQQAYGSWSVIQSGQVSLQDALELLDQPLPDYVDKSLNKPMPFKREISLKQISFRYSLELPFILKHLNINIAKGSRVGFIGATGGGKSTLIDIIMGLLQPTDGTLEIDGQVINQRNKRAWQDHIAHVPQVIFLTDGTIEENIAFGVPKNQIDKNRVRQAAQQAQIAESIESLPKRYQTFVGERGVRLSGGQRQRIGIARALYKQADVIIFDEATSALDNETELAVMRSIERLSKDLTLLIIAHRLTTLKDCTLIVELGKGGIERTGSYQDIVSQSAVKQKNKEN
jgi:ABC-type multidrug transport system fused ATPase/permease subunit